MTFSWPRLTWPAWDARQAGPRRRKMSATSTAGRDNGGASAGHLQQQVERARHLADRADGDAGIERRRLEFLMSERTRAIMLTFYVIEIESSAERDPMLASSATLFCSRYAARSSALITHGAPLHSWRPLMMSRRTMRSAVIMLTSMICAAASSVISPRSAHSLSR